MSVKYIFKLSYNCHKLENNSAPEDHRIVTEAETLGEAFKDESRDVNEDTDVTRLILAPRRERSLQGCSC